MLILLSDAVNGARCRRRFCDATSSYNAAARRRR